MKEVGQIAILKLRKESLAVEINRVKKIIHSKVNNSGGDDNADEHRALLAQLQKEYDAL